MISTEPDGYALRSGSSSAAPFVAGTVALLLSADELVPVEMVRGRILSVCEGIESIGESLYGCSGCGRIRADLSIIGAARHYAIPVGSELVVDESSDDGVYPPSRRFLFLLRMRKSKLLTKIHCLL